MKTSELIKHLQEADPSGEMECCLGNHDIHYVSAEPAYWDGCLQVLKRDPNKQYYNIIGAEYRSSGDKLVIHGLSVMDAILNDPEVPVTYDSDYARRHYEAVVEAERDEVRGIKQKIREKK
jgi:hypothetical protein